MKELKPDLIRSVEDLREFVMEASIQRKLQHKCDITLFRDSLYVSRF